METKSCPNIVLITLIVLGVIGVYGAYDSAVAFTDWYRWHSGTVPLELIGRSLAYGVIPILACLVMIRGYLFGRYLGLVSLLYFFGVMLGIFMDFLSAQPSQRAVDFPFLVPALLANVVLLALILKLGFDKEVTAYFSAENRDH
jgi:hypothetical protein